MNENNNDIFRKKNLDKVSSVDELEGYIKTTTPSLWILLSSIIILLAGIIVWASIGKINIECTAGCIAKDNMITCFVSEDRIKSLTENSYIEINNEKVAIIKLSGPFQDINEGEESLLYTSNIENGSWYYQLSGNYNISNGIYKCKIVFEEVSPITYIIN